MSFHSRQHRRHGTDREADRDAAAAQYRMLFEDNPRPMWIYDLETLHFLEINDAAIAHYGYSRQEFEAMTIFDIRPDSEHERLKNNLDGNRDAFERSGIWLHRRSDGTLIEVAIDSHITIWNDRRAILVIARDVTERNRVARENVQFNEELQALLQVAKELSLALNEHVVLRRTIEGVMLLLRDADMAAIWLTTEDTTAVYEAAWAMRGGTITVRKKSDSVVGMDDVGSDLHTETEPKLVDPADYSLFFDVPEAKQLPTTGLAAPLRMEDKPLGVLIAASYAADDPFGDRQLRLMHALASQTAIALTNAKLVAHIRRIPHELIQAQEDERRHLAHELHDEVGAVLTSLSLCLTMLRPVVSNGDEQAWKSLEHAEGLVKSMTEEVRSMALRLRPSVLDDLGLLAAVNWLIRQYASSLTIEFHHELEPEKRFSPAVELTAFRVIQEAVTNAARHAKVSRIQVAVTIESGKMRISVVDGGLGFDYQKALRSRRSVGLLGMRERLARLHGMLEIKSRPGEGTRLTATLPLG